MYVFFCFILSRLLQCECHRLGTLAAEDSQTNLFIHVALCNTNTIQLAQEQGFKRLMLGPQMGKVYKVARFFFLC